MGSGPRRKVTSIELPLALASAAARTTSKRQVGTLSDGGVLPFSNHSEERVAIERPFPLHDSSVPMI
jgi:hypothetical protein